MIGKINVNRSKASVGNESNEEVGCIGVDDPGVAETVPSQAVASVHPVAPGVLDSQEVDMGPDSGLLYDESAFPHSYL